MAIRLYFRYSIWKRFSLSLLYRSECCCRDKNAKSPWLHVIQNFRISLFNNWFLKGLTKIQWNLWYSNISRVFDSRLYWTLHKIHQIIIWNLVLYKTFKWIFYLLFAETFPALRASNIPSNYSISSFQELLVRLGFLLLFDWIEKQLTISE